MLLAMAASGAYIQNGRSPDVDDILDYLDGWLTNLNEFEEVEVAH